MLQYKNYLYNFLVVFTLAKMGKKILVIVMFKSIISDTRKAKLDLDLQVFNEHFIQEQLVANKPQKYFVGRPRKFVAITLLPPQVIK
jgi:hypothetical protein